MTQRNRWTLVTTTLFAVLVHSGNAAGGDGPQEQPTDTPPEPLPRYDENRHEAICDAWRFPKSDSNVGGLCRRGSRTKLFRSALR